MKALKGLSGQKKCARLDGEMAHTYAHVPPNTAHACARLTLVCAHASNHGSAQDRRARAVRHSAPRGPPSARLATNTRPLRRNPGPRVPAFVPMPRPSAHPHPHAARGAMRPEADDAHPTTPGSTRRRAPRRARARATRSCTIRAWAHTHVTRDKQAFGKAAEGSALVRPFNGHNT